MTWRGPCPKRIAGKACTGKIVARRLKPGEQGAGDDPAGPAAATTGPRKSRVLKVANAPNSAAGSAGGHPPAQVPAANLGSAPAGGNGRPGPDDGAAGKPVDVKPPTGAGQPGGKPSTAPRPESGSSRPYAHIFGW